jgi:DNA gyrase subunit A
MAQTIHPVSITQETRRRYLNYALSVITSRALPDVRDGLKPVQRRILYVMHHELHLDFDGRPRKCAQIVGDVMGKFHPHGDAAIYDALVRMAQPFVMRAPLVHGQGNFGSVDGDPPAAYRYTEAKLSAIADTLLSELRQNTVDVRPTYDGEREEPVVLPAQFPNLLVNGTSGIAVGLATNIPPHNLSDVVAAAVHLIESPSASTADLLNKLKGPDFPLGGKIVTDRPTLRHIYEDGTGSVRVQGEWKTEARGKKEYLVITSIPYGVDKGKLEHEIGGFIENRALPQLLSLTNESNEKEGLRIALEMKAGSDPYMVVAYLYKHSALQQNFAYNMTCLVPGDDGQPRPERLGLKEMLRYFLDFRFETVKRRFEYDLAQLRKRIHILEGFKIVFDALDRAIKLIRESDGKAEAAEKLKAAFKLDDEQAAAILDTQLYKIAQLEIKKILDELREKKKQAAEIEEILGSKRRLWTVVKQELNALAEKYGERRRTRMAGEEDVPEFDEEAYIIRENANVVLTRDGWIKRVGRLTSVETTRIREGDAVIAVVPGSTLDYVAFFADDGTAYTLRINEVPASTGYGEPITKFFKLDDNVKVITAVSADERFTPADHSRRKSDPPEPYILVATAHGQVLRTPISPFRTASTKVGRRYVRLSEGDKVVMVGMPHDEESVMLASAEGRLIHFPLEDVNVLAGVGKGVMGIKLDDGDSCLGGALIGSRFDALVVETSGGKSMELRRGAYRVHSRGGKGYEVVKRSTLVRVLPPAIELVNWEEMEGANGNGSGNGKAKGKPSDRNGQAGGLFD